MKIPQLRCSNPSPANMHMFTDLGCTWLADIWLDSSPYSLSGIFACGSPMLWPSSCANALIPLVTGSCSATFKQSHQEIMCYSMSVNSALQHLVMYACKCSWIMLLMCMMPELYLVHGEAASIATLFASCPTAYAWRIILGYNDHPMPILSRVQTNFLHQIENIDMLLTYYPPCISNDWSIVIDDTKNL